MKIKRLKSYRKTIEIYEKRFGLCVEPLEIFVDNTFARQALIHKLNIDDQFKCTLNRPFQLVTSSCVIAECDALGTLFESTGRILRDFKLLKCGHKYLPSKSAPWCIRKRIRLVKNSKSNKTGILFALASNDEAIREFTRLVPGMPIFFIAHNRINLEPIPGPVQEQLNEMQIQSTSVSLSELHHLHNLEQQFGLVKCLNQKKKKKAREPNPLSCKRKIIRSVIRSNGETVKKKRKRKRSRIKVTWALKQILSRLKSEMGIPVPA